MAAEWLQTGDAASKAMYAPARRDFDRYLRMLQDAAAGVNLPEGWVSNSTYWLVRDGTTIVATSNLRHFLNEHLSHEGGHIGYDTRPSERRRGYGTAVCAATLAKARQLGLRRVLITCDSDNVASARIIEKNGGRLENQVVSHTTGKVKNRYWIDV